MPRNTQVTIDPKAIEHNLAQVRQWAGDARIMAVVKADAYGHRLDLCVPALSQADLLAVATLEEARAIRRLGINQGILLLEGVSHEADLSVVEELDLELTVHHIEQVRALERWGRSPTARIWIKVDSGMHRLGVPPEMAAMVYERLRCLGGLGHIHWMSHFASAEGDEQHTQTQSERFQEATAGLPGDRCLANSAALIRYPETHHQWVRAGVVLYGISPLVDQWGPALGLRPAMTVEAELIAINDVAAGEPIGYGGRFVTAHPMRIGVAAIGYGDGYPRAMQDGAPVLVGGRRSRLVGRVSMDMITIDLTECPDVAIGDAVRLWGEGLPVEEAASFAQTIPYELVCRMTRRVRYNIAP